MNIRPVVCSLSLIAGVFLSHSVQAQKPNDPGMVPFTPFEIVNNVYYVGSKDQSSFLIKTNAGLVLVNSGYAGSAPLIEDSVKKLGLKLSDIKILLISHAHIDHDAGSAAILKDTGAKYEVMEPDVSVVESGGATDFQNGKIPSEQYPPTHVDRVLHDGDKIDLGGEAITAHLTPGHTKGCATYTFDETQDGKALHVLILCGTAASAGPNRDYKLLNNPDYPQIVSDFDHAFEVLPTLPCNVFLGAHGRYFNLDEKYAKLQTGDKDAFIGTGDDYQAYMARAKQGFERQLKRAQDAAAKPANP